MCLAIPALITSISGSTARANIGGMEALVSIVFAPYLKEGDYAIIHAGFAIGVMNDGEAVETLRLLKTAMEGDEE